MARVSSTGAVLLALSIASTALSYFLCSNAFSFSRTAKVQKKKKKQRSGLVEAIGNTPLIKINSLSDATGCQILGKAEFLNPGGSVKDRVAVKIFEEALESGKLAQGGVVTEGSAGSTAISLATVAPAYGCKCHVVIPDDVAIEKSEILEALGATVERVRPVSITHKDHYVNIARRRALEANEVASKRSKSEQIDGKDLEHMNGYITYGATQDSVFSSECKGGFFADQFENLANFRAHYEGSGPEIWEQTGGNINAFVAAAGTGGTVAGVSKFLKEKSPDIACFLIDPPGSGLFNKVTRGVMYTNQEAEGRRLKNPFDTVTEGIGINRITQNFMMAELDGAFRGTDMEAVEMSRLFDVTVTLHNKSDIPNWGSGCIPLWIFLFGKNLQPCEKYLLKNDGLFLGSSSAMNCVGAVKVAQLVGPGHTIVTILCDSGMRHLSKFYDAQYLSKHGLTPLATGLEFLGLK